MVFERPLVSSLTFQHISVICNYFLHCNIISQIILYFVISLVSLQKFLSAINYLKCELKIIFIHLFNCNIKPFWEIMFVTIFLFICCNEWWCHIPLDSATAVLSWMFLLYNTASIVILQLFILSSKTYSYRLPFTCIPLKSVYLQPPFFLYSSINSLIIKIL